MNNIPFHVEPIDEPSLMSVSTLQDVDQPETAASFKTKGMIRAHGLIDIALNERLKALARKQDRHAAQLIGELITRAAVDIDRLEAEQEANRLRDRFGDHWLDLLKKASE